MANPAQIGGCTLYLGDCLEILPTLPKVDAVVTDPPYGIDGTWSGGNSHGWGKFRGEAEPWDTRPEWFSDWLLNLNVPSIVWGGQYFKLPPTGSWLIWDKIVRKFSSGHGELAWTNLQQPIRAFNYSHGQVASEGKRHPTQKPLALMEWCLGFIPTARNIADPFMGSGTTLVACAKQGRKGIGIELEPKYFDIACERIWKAYDQPDLFVAPPEKPVQEKINFNES